MRLQRYIALSSPHSRRKAEVLIREGKVSVNGKVVVKMGTIIDTSKDIIILEGEKLEPKKNYVYVMLNKPAGFLSTCSDTHGRKTVLDLIPFKDVYPVGRLDKNTEGLLLLTNDGDAAYKITHPKFEHEKEYIVYFKNKLSPTKKEQLTKGILIDGKKTNPCKILKNSQKNNHYICHIILKEGRKRQIRRMFEEIGNPVIYLKRIRIGNLHLGNLKKGSYKELKKSQINIC